MFLLIFQCQSCHFDVNFTQEKCLKDSGVDIGYITECTWGKCLKKHIYSGVNIGYTFIGKPGLCSFITEGMLPKREINNESIQEYYINLGGQMTLTS